MTMVWECPECGQTIESPDTDDPYECRGPWTVDDPWPHGGWVEMELVEQ
ncbi:hypothetical protein ACFQJ8_20135 [Halocatena marina]